MEINEFEAGMLDAVLEAFDGTDRLNKEQILELFGGDEQLAVAVIELLIASGMVVAGGTNERDELPAYIVRNAPASAFLENGGFTAQLHADKIASSKAETSETGISTDTATVSNQTKATVAELDEPLTPAKKQFSEIVFEIEVAKGDEAYQEPELPFQSAADKNEADAFHELAVDSQEQTQEISTKEVEEPDVESKQEALPENAPGNTFAPASVPPEELYTAPENEAIFTPATTQPDTEQESLREALFKLQKEKILSENQLREKDNLIQSLETRNKQLAQLRTFIWLLLAIILFQVIWLITHSKG